MTADVDRLLDQARWVESFARALVREDADDVAQDAWLAAVQHPPAPADSPRPWFATVMRNIKRMRFRSASRRRVREDASATAAVDRSVPTPAELAHRMELQRRLASAVLALEEPGRSTVVLVFYEGLSPADVARRDGVPATTVRSRLRAALVTLRARLDTEEAGDRGRWHLALAPLVTPKLAVATAPLWPLAFASIAVLVTTGAVVALAVPSDPARTDVPGARSTDTRALAISAASRPPAPLSTPTIATTGDPRIAHATSMTPAFRDAEKALMSHVDECYEIAHRVGRDLKGIVRLTISLEATAIGVEASVEVDTEHTTITDPEFLECIRENAMAIEDHLERGEDIEGPLRLEVVREMPPTKTGAELVQILPTNDDDAMTCPAGTALVGTPGVRQWCALPDGTKLGPEWSWDEDGSVSSRTIYDRGSTSIETIRR